MMQRAKPGARALLAIDIDGTLVGAADLPAASDVLAVQAASLEGIVCTLVTGRLFSAAQHVAQLVGITGPIACGDGAHVVSADATTHAHWGLSREAAATVRSVVEKAGASAFLLVGGAVRHQTASAPLVHHLSPWSRTFAVVDGEAWVSAWGESLTGVVVVGTGVELEAIRARLLPAGWSVDLDVLAFPLSTSGCERTFIPTLAETPTRPDAPAALYVRRRGANKGNALKWLAWHYGVALEDTVCIGDSGNDIPMFAAAGRAFAMPSAPPDLLRVATDLLEHVDRRALGPVACVLSFAFGVDADAAFANRRIVRSSSSGPDGRRR